MKHKRKWNRNVKKRHKQEKKGRNYPLEKGNSNVSTIRSKNRSWGGVTTQEIDLKCDKNESNNKEKKNEQNSVRIVQF